MNDLSLTAALGDYDHARDLALGRVRPEGISLRVLNFPVEEIFFQFFENAEWDVSEMSMGMYTSALSRGDDRFIAIPVFPSRVFRMSAIYVRSDAAIVSAAELAGRRIGIPQWSQTATIYVRGYLAETVGIDLSGIAWVQAGVNDPGRPEYSTIALPPGINLEVVSDASLSDMLLDGQLDAIITARPPKAFVAGDPRVRRLFFDYKAVEQDYFKASGIFPIMHTVVIRRDVYERNRWIARNLLLAFNEAKERSVARILDQSASHIALPWAAELAEASGRQSLFKGHNYWPYGIAANRPTLDAFLRFAFDQGVCHRRLTPEDIFAKEALTEIRI